MKKNKKPIIALLVVAIVGIIGITFAFFSDKINVSNIFKTKSYGTTVTEVFVSPDNWLPGTNTEKVVKVKNSGKVDEAVRISFTEEWKTKNDGTLSGWLHTDGTKSAHTTDEELESDVRAALINFTNKSDWKKVTENGTDYYYYKYKLAEGEETSAFIDSVTFNAITKLDDTCEEPVTENGKTTITCNSNGADYDNATYTLTFTIETVQFDKYKEAWNTSFDIKEEKGSSLASFVATNGTIYDGNGANTFENDVYFLGDNDKNNVVFANKCWKIVRTTETGGVKILYNGELKEESVYELDKLSDTDLVNIVNDSTYSYDSSTKEWTSINHTDNATGTITFSVPESGEYVIEYKVSSEANYDKAKIYKGEEQLAEVSGENEGYFNLGTIDSSIAIKVEYTKDSSDRSGNDNVIFSIGKVTSVEKKFTCNNSGSATTIGNSKFNNYFNSPAYVGYMYNTVYEYKEEIPAAGSKFSSDVEYNGTTYTLKEPTTTTKDNDHHYTCNSSTEVTCDKVRYYYFDNYYIELDGTESIESTLKEMLSDDDVNKKDSTIKSKIDSWYEENMIDYEDYLEDTVFCNDRSITSKGGWNPNGGSLSSILQFKEYTVSSDLTCSNDIDKFTKEKSNGNGALKYPVGLLSSPEANLWGSTARNNNYYYWLGSPYYFYNVNARERLVDRGNLDIYGVYYTGGGVRPAVSLAPGTTFISGTGSTNDPFIVPTEE